MKKAKLEKQKKRLLPRKLDIAASAEDLLDEFFMIKEFEDWPLSKSYNEVKPPSGFLYNDQKHRIMNIGPILNPHFHCT
mgnify:CR=1 FL=1